jgi:hypothetical protein
MNLSAFVLVVMLLKGAANAMPSATAAVLNAFDVNGWSPAPTAAVQVDLFKRQGNNDLTICGYLDGDPCQY